MNVNTEQALPCSIEAEQQVLGAILLDPELINRIGPMDPAAFFEDCHRDLFMAMRAKHHAGELVSPITMREMAESHEGLKTLGGGRYLVTMAACAVASYAILDYCAIIVDAHDRRRLIATFQDAMAEALHDDSKPGDISARVQASLAASMASRKSMPTSMASASEVAMEMAFEAYQTGVVPGIKSGIATLDDLIGGFRPADMVILGGRPSMGKTAVALSMILNAARAGTGVVVASLEMTPESLALRAISEASTSIPGGSVPYVDIGRGEFEEAQGRQLVEAAGAVSKLPITILPMSFRDMSAIQAGVSQAAATHLRKTGLGLVVIDYLQIVQMAGSSRYDKISEISIAIKAMAAQLQVPVLVLAQLNRMVEQRDDKRPMMSDLKESGQLEQDADTIIFCYRDEYYLERARPDHGADMEDVAEWQERMERAQNRLELIVAKQRQGPIGTARVGFNAATNLIWDL